MMQVAICDDDIITTSTIEAYIKEIAKKEHIKVEYSIFFDGNSFVQSIQNGKVFDLVYLDIEIPYIDGINGARTMRDMELSTLIVYISNYETYFRQLFDTEPFRFLSKPIDDKELFENVFMAAYKRVKKSAKFFMYTYNKIIYKVCINEIMYFESNNRLIYIHTRGTKNDGKFYNRLSSIEKDSAIKCNRFLRIHQSYLVNYEYIQSVGSSAVRLYDGTVLQISENRQRSIRKQFCEMVDNEGYDE